MSCYTQVYSDDLVLVVFGKYASKVSERMQETLKIMEGWCRKEKFSVNPDKTALVPSTKR